MEIMEKGSNVRMDGDVRVSLMVKMIRRWGLKKCHTCNNKFLGKIANSCML